ncbi:hypothetical protein ACQ4LE_008369 [Meloidogyne hapla]
MVAFWFNGGSPTDAFVRGLYTMVACGSMVAALLTLLSGAYIQWWPVVQWWFKYKWIGKRLFVFLKFSLFCPQRKRFPNFNCFTGVLAFSATHPVMFDCSNNWNVLSVLKSKG